MTTAVNIPKEKEMLSTKAIDTSSAMIKKTRKRAPRPTLDTILNDKGKIDRSNSILKALHKTYGKDWAKHIKIMLPNTNSIDKVQCCALTFNKKDGCTRRCSRKAPVGDSGMSFCGLHGKVHGAVNTDAVNCDHNEVFEYKWQQYGYVDSDGKLHETSWVSKYRDILSKKKPRAKKKFVPPEIPENQSLEDWKNEQTKKHQAKIERMQKKFQEQMDLVNENLPDTDDKKTNDNDDNKKDEDTENSESEEWE